MHTADQITAAARNAYHAALESGLDVGAALDNAGEAIKPLLGDRTGTFDQESLTWSYDARDLAPAFRDAARKK